MAETASSAGTAPVDPTFDLLDRPIALGGADDVVLTAAAPETPTIDGRPVEDPRLIAALSQPVDITRAELLDRTAKLAGVLELLGGRIACCLRIAADVPEPARTFAVFAGVRLGVPVDLRADAPCATPDDMLTLVTAEGEAHESALKGSVRSVRSYAEGLGIAGGGEVRDLDRLMRDGRIQPLASRGAQADACAIRTDDGDIARADAAAFLSGLLAD